VKQAMKDKINRDLKQYYQLGDNRGQSNLSSAKQTILELLTFKYSQMCENKRIIQANNEFLNMAKIILKEPQTSCPIVGLKGLIKLQTFDQELSLHG